MFFASASVFTSMCAQWTLSGMDVSVDLCVLYCFWDAFYISAIHAFPANCGEYLGQPLLCRLGLHRWANYGKEVLIFWQEPGLVYGLSTKSKVVFEKRRCLRCGVRFKRILSTNPDETFSAAGWAADTEDDQPQE